MSRDTAAISGDWQRDMVNQIATYAAVAAIVLFFAFIAWVMIARARTAKLTLRVAEGEVQPGAVIETVLRIEAKRAFQWDRIVMALVCVDTRDDGGSAGRRLVYQDEFEVSGPGRMSARAIAEYHAEFVTPTGLEPAGIPLPLPEAAEAVLEPLFKVTEGRRARDFHWQIEARLDSKLELSVARRLDFSLTP